MNILESQREVDASLCLLQDSEIIFASQAERHSRIKNDFKLHHTQFPTSEKYLPERFYDFVKILDVCSGQKWQRTSV